MLGIRRKLSFFRRKRAEKKKNTTIMSEYISKDCTFGEWCIVGKCVLIGENVNVGKYSYFNSSKKWIIVDSNVSIGNFCSIAPGVSIGMGNHEYKYVSTHPFLYNKYYKDISSKCALQVEGLKDNRATTIIGNDVWIGADSIIKRGVTIGNGAVVAAGSVVTKAVPPYSIVGGVPAKVIKYRTTKENIDFFEANEEKMWWNWDSETIANRINTLYNFDDYKSLLENDCSVDEL